MLTSKLTQNSATNSQILSDNIRQHRDSAPRWARHSAERSSVRTNELLSTKSGSLPKHERLGQLPDECLRSGGHSTPTPKAAEVAYRNITTKMQIDIPAAPFTPSHQITTTNNNRVVQKLVLTWAIFASSAIYAAAPVCDNHQICATHTSTLTEYRHVPSGIHFATACQEEKTFVQTLKDASGAAQFVETGRSTPVSATSAAPFSQGLGRYVFGETSYASTYTGPKTSRHFYGVIAQEVQRLEATLTGKDKTYACNDGADSAYGMSPSGVTVGENGVDIVNPAGHFCPSKSTPVWRVLTAQPTAHHRFTADYGFLRTGLLNVPGTENELVRFCAPADGVTFSIATPVGVAQPALPPSGTATLQLTANNLIGASATSAKLHIVTPADVTVTQVTLNDASSSCSDAPDAALPTEARKRCVLPPISAGTNATLKLTLSRASGATGATVVKALIAPATATDSELDAGQCAETGKPNYGCHLATLPQAAAILEVFPTNAALPVGVVGVAYPPPGTTAAFGCRNAAGSTATATNVRCEVSAPSPLPAGLVLTGCTKAASLSPGQSIDCSIATAASSTLNAAYDGFMQITATADAPAQNIQKNLPLKISIANAGTGAPQVAITEIAQVANSTTSNPNRTTLTAKFRSTSGSTENFFTWITSSARGFVTLLSEYSDVINSVTATEIVKTFDVTDISGIDPVNLQICVTRNDISRTPDDIIKNACATTALSAVSPALQVTFGSTAPPPTTRLTVDRSGSFQGVVGSAVSFPFSCTNSGGTNIASANCSISGLPSPLGVSNSPLGCGNSGNASLVVGQTLNCIVVGTPTTTASNATISIIAAINGSPSDAWDTTLQVNAPTPSADFSKLTIANTGTQTTIANATGVGGKITLSGLSINNSGAAITSATLWWKNKDDVNSIWQPMLSAPISLGSAATTAVPSTDITVNFATATVQLCATSSAFITTGCDSGTATTTNVSARLFPQFGQVTFVPPAAFTVTMSKGLIPANDVDLALGLSETYSLSFYNSGGSDLTGPFGVYIKLPPAFEFVSLVPTTTTAAFTCTTTGVATNVATPVTVLCANVIASQEVVQPGASNKKEYTLTVRPIAGAVTATMAASPSYSFVAAISASTVAAPSCPNTTTNGCFPYIDNRARKYYNLQAQADGAATLAIPTTAGQSKLLACKNTGTTATENSATAPAACTLTVTTATGTTTYKTSATAPVAATASAPSITLYATGSAAPAGTACTPNSTGGDAAACYVVPATAPTNVKLEAGTAGQFENALAAKMLTASALPQGYTCTHQTNQVDRTITGADYAFGGGTPTFFGLSAPATATGPIYVLELRPDIGQTLTSAGRTLPPKFTIYEHGAVPEGIVMYFSPCRGDFDSPDAIFPYAKLLGGVPPKSLQVHDPSIVPTVIMVNENARQSAPGFAGVATVNITNDRPWYVNIKSKNCPVGAPCEVALALLLASQQ